MPGAKRPLQVKPAVGAIEKEEERRLFVGMLGKKTNEDDLRAMFGVYGNVESCVVLRERDGTSRGCAFVTFTVRKSALKAIASLNRSKTMEDCHKPMVVKFADTHKEKEMRNDNFSSSMSSTHTNVGSSGTGGLSSMQFLGPPPSFSDRGVGSSDSWQPPPTNVPPPPLMPTIGGTSMTQNLLPSVQNLQQQLQAQIQGLAALAALATNPVLSAVLNPNLGLLQQLAGATGGAGLNLGIGGSNQVLPGTDIMSQALAGMQQFNDAFGSSSGTNNMNTGMNLNTQNMNFGVNTGTTQQITTLQQQQQQQSSVQQYNPRDAHLKVPEGSNLFLFHLPPEYREANIEMLFAPYGKVVSSKVFVDKVTNQSKCYGFVSYDNPNSAQNAIRALNGHVISGRKLRVQLKGPRDSSKPY
jgi:RNA recognition motif-containing protein